MLRTESKNTTHKDAVQFFTNKDSSSDGNRNSLFQDKRSVSAIQRKIISLSKNKGNKNPDLINKMGLGSKPVQRIIRIGVAKNILPVPTILNQRALIIEHTTPVLAKRGIHNIPEETWNFIFDQLILIAGNEETFDFERTSDIIVQIFPNHTAEHVMQQNQPFGGISEGENEILSDDEIIPEKKKVRSRKRHNLSDGESENEDEDIVWRSLRKEEQVGISGVRPPKDHNPNLTASQHISAGSRAIEKSPWVSASRSRKVAGAWASESGKKLAKIQIPKNRRGVTGPNGEQDVYDITNSNDANKVFPSGEGSTLNTAKSSQEVVIKNGLGPENILALYEARKISVKQYNELKILLSLGDEIFIDGLKVYAIFRTRTEAKKPPLPRLLLVLPLIKASDVIPLIHRDFQADELEDDEIYMGHEIDDDLLAYAISVSKSAEEAAFIYVDIYRSMN